MAWMKVRPDGGLMQVGENGGIGFGKSRPRLRFRCAARRGTSVPEFALPSLTPRMESACARCGAPFHCGRDDAAGCWCARLPALPPDRYDASAGCLCEACLNRMLDAAAPAPRP